MNEIKEILDKLKDSVDNPTFDVPTYDGSDSEPMDNIAIIKPNACKQLLDYITNLQEENKEYSMIFDTFSKRPYAHKYLEEKKKKLNNNKIIGLDSEMVYKDYYDYKSRCEQTFSDIERTIEIIKQQPSEDDTWILDRLSGFEYILQGSDEE